MAMRTTNKSLRGIAGKPKRGFKGNAAALLVSAAMGLGACGDTIHNHYYETDGGAPTVNVEAPEVNVDVPDVTVNMPSDSTEVSALCADDIEVPFEATFNQGESVQLVNGLRLQLTDLESESQTAFFHLTDDMGNVLAHVDMVEGVEGTIDLGDGDVAIVACSVRIGDTFSEKSVTIRSDTDISRPAPECGIEEGETGFRRTLENGVTQDVRQTVQYDTCEERGPLTILSERQTLEPALEAGEDGEGLADSMRLTVNVCSETYTIVGVHPDGLDLGKEAVTVLLNEGSLAVLATDFNLILDGVENHVGVDRALIGVYDESGEMTHYYAIAAQTTIPITVGTETYSLHVYSTSDSGSSEPAWARIAILSSVTELREGELTDLTCSSAGGDVDGTYSFSMQWGPGNTIRGWELTRE